MPSSRNRWESYCQLNQR